MTSCPHENEAERSGAATYSSAMASAHRYIDWMLSPFRSSLHGDIVEIGIGHGSYYEALAPYGAYLGVDIDEDSVRCAQARYPQARFARADIMAPDFLEALLPEKADAICCINVLEHVRDDETAMRNLVGGLKPGGRLLITVPALRALYNDLDRLAGHHRRYHLPDFRGLCSRLPVTIEKLCYFNPLGALGWYLNSFRRHDSLNSEAVNGQILFFERYVLPVSRFLDPMTRSFLGQSLVCIATRR